MRRIHLLRLVGVGIVTVIFQSLSGSLAARTLEDYPLVCRGGGPLVIGFEPGERNIGFVFTRGSKPAGEGLSPGECSWVDRGMYSNEPDRVSQHVDEGSESLKVGAKLAPENRWFEELHSSDKYWTFMVWNNGRGQLIATSARPNKRTEVLPTVRVPSGVELSRPTPTPTPAPGTDLADNLQRARTLDDEKPGMIVLTNPPEPGSTMELLKDLPIGRNMTVVPGPPILSREEKMALLKSAGLEAFSETPTPFVTLTPQQPKVAGKGSLAFYFAMWVSQREDGVVFKMLDSPDIPNGALLVGLDFENPGIYLMTFTVRTSGYVIKPVKPVTMDAAELFVFTPPDGVIQTFLAKKTTAWQRLNMIVEVATPGSYTFSLEVKSSNTKIWFFHSCEVTLWKK